MAAARYRLDRTHPLEVTGKKDGRHAANDALDPRSVDIVNVIVCIRAPTCFDHPILGVVPQGVGRPRDRPSYHIAVAIVVEALSCYRETAVFIFLPEIPFFVNVLFDFEL